MRILHIIPSLSKGGAERLCLDMVRALRKLPNVEYAHIAILNPQNEYAEEYPDIKPFIIKSKVIPSITGKWKVNLQDWNILLENLNPDIVHSHLFEADFLARYEIRPNIGYISHCHDNMHQLAPLKPNEWFNKKRLTEWYERRFIINQYQKANNIFLAISHDTESYFKSVMPSNLNSRICFIPNAIDISRYVAPNPTFIDGETLRLINIGSFVEKKNQTFLIDVVAKLKNDGIPVHLDLVGDGTLRAEVENKAQQMDLRNEVRFHGKISMVESLLSQNHIYVHSATYEPFGLVLLEAMASGLPVVCLDAKGNRELIVDGKNGYMLPEQNVSVFAQKITSIAFDSKAYKLMSKAAKEKASQYDIIPYANRLLEIYALKARSKNG